MDTFTLQNETLRLEFDRTTGALIGLTALPSGWPILDRPHLGLSFRLLVPLASDDPLDVEFAARMGRPQPSRRNNAVYGEKQTLNDLQLAADGTGATFTWDNVVSELGGPLPIKVVLSVTLTARQAVYAVTIENRSPHIVENVYCPYLGDVQHPTDAEWFKTFLYSYATAQEWSLWPTFQNFRGRIVFEDFETSFREPKVAGDTVRFAFTDEEGRLRRFDGRIDGDNVAGTVYDGANGAPFTATRIGKAPAIIGSAPAQENEIYDN